MSGSYFSCLFLELPSSCLTKWIAFLDDQEQKRDRVSVFPMGILSQTMLKVQTEFGDSCSHGGSGGQGGDHGGNGGTGEGTIVHQHFPTSAVQASRLLNHCPPPSRIFHGRRTVLDAMHHFFAQETGKQKIYVLYGLGGAGKTQIALKFIEEWTHLKNLATTKQSGNSMQDALSWLLNNNGEWLLFFDNADDPNINLNQFFPKCTHGNIVITSRNPNLRAYGAHSQVSDMDKADAMELLLKSAHQEASEPNKLLAMGIVKALWYLPLAIVQAGAFLLECGTLDTYLDLFTKNCTELLKNRSRQNQYDYAWAVYTTWEMSFRKLSQPAAMFLQLCSLLHQDDIFEEIFSRAANLLFSLPESLNKPRRLKKLKSKLMKIVSLGGSQSESVLELSLTKAKEFLSHFVGPTGEWDSLQFLKITNEIAMYSLMKFDAGRKSFSIHPLVHSWSQTTLDNPQPYHLCIDAILGVSIQAIPQQDMRIASLRLVSHVDSVMQAISKSTFFGWQYANIYYQVGRHTEAAELQIIEVEKHSKLLGDDHLTTLDAIHNLGLTYHGWGQLEKAERHKVLVLEKSKKLLGNDHPDTLIAMQSLARTYNRLGRFEEAEKLQVLVLDKRRKCLGDDHLDTIHAMWCLSVTYDSWAKFEEAMDLQVIVLGKWRRVFGDDHLNTVDAMHNLANTYKSLGRYEEAEKLQIAVLEKRKRFLGDQHPHTQIAIQNLAEMYTNLRKQAEAAEVEGLDQNGII
ncbi:P-loop containing nucleoside triphosphate hydrolase protein [Mycena sanguinolenta]|nr:P-loop containing nucleoside triphosphate hydrolase protein [Mycena sanguinolenta]